MSVMRHYNIIIIIVIIKTKTSGKQAEGNELAELRRTEIMPNNISVYGDQTREETMMRLAFYSRE